MEFTGEFTYFLMIFARMSGCIFFNQVLGRGNLPNILKISLSLFLAITVYGILPPARSIIIVTPIEYSFLILKEIFIGYILGYIVSLFLSTVIIGGEVMGIQTGMSMASIYDPTNNISTGITGSFLNLILMLIFFSANGHLTLLQIFITSCKLVEIGNFTIPKDLFYNMVELFQQILILSLKISMPIIAVEIILEAGIGILMKAIPQIQVFSVNVQLKILVSLLMIVILVPTFSMFLEKIVILMFDMLKESLIMIT